MQFKYIRKSYQKFNILKKLQPYRSLKMSSVDSKENIRRFVQFKGGILSTLKMLEEGIISDINIRYSGHYDCTALMYQAYYGTVESMESLLTHKPPALVNLQSSNGYTALHLAVHH